MSIPLTINGATFNYPVDFDEAWGVDATGWAQAVTNGMLQLQGGSFPLTADVNFGGTFGIISTYYKSRSANIATAGVVRLASADAIEWRNAANTGNNVLSTTGDILLYNGAPISGPSLTNTHIFVGNASNLPTDVAMSGDTTISNTGVVSINPNLTLTSLKSNSANTAASGFLRLANSTDAILWRNAANSADLALTVNGANQLQFGTLGLPVINGAFTANTVAVWSAVSVLGYPGLLSSAVTTTELGYLSGTTSSVQTQISGKLPLAGGTMSGTINMGSNKITGLTSLNDTFIGYGRNYLLNGEMRFDQNKEGGAYTSNDHTAKYSLDQWRFEATGTPAIEVTRDPTVVPFAAGGTYSLRVRVTTSGAPGATDGCNIEYPAEPRVQKSWRWGTSDAVTVTLSFWVLCATTGTYSVSLLNGVDSQSYVSTYTINVANTWEYKTITVPGPTTGGTAAWPIDGLVFGLKVVWDLGSGTNVTTSSTNTWLAGALWKATGSTNVVQTANNNWYMDLVQLEIGSQASAFEFTPDDIMLPRLQRFYYKTFAQGTAAAAGSTFVGAIPYILTNAGIFASGPYLRFPVPMFSAPTVLSYSPANGTTKWYNANRAADSGDVVPTGTDSIGTLLVNSQVSADAAQQGVYTQITANARLGGS